MLLPRPRRALFRGVSISRSFYLPLLLCPFIFGFSSFSLSPSPPLPLYHPLPPFPFILADSARYTAGWKFEGNLDLLSPREASRVISLAGPRANADGSLRAPVERTVSIARRGETHEFSRTEQTVVSCCLFNNRATIELPVKLTFTNFPVGTPRVQL